MLLRFWGWLGCGVLRSFGGLFDLSRLEIHLGDLLLRLGRCGLDLGIGCCLIRRCAPQSEHCGRDEHDEERFQSKPLCSTVEAVSPPRWQDTANVATEKTPSIDVSRGDRYQAPFPPIWHPSADQVSNSGNIANKSRSRVFTNCRSVGV